MKVLRWFDKHFEEALLVLLLVIISVVSLMQVIIRNIPWIPALKWAEEFCRFCWIWSVFLSLPYTIQHGSMLRVTVLMDVMPGKLKKAINIFVDIITIFCMGFLCYYSVPTIMRIYTSNETSPAMLWSMWIVYSIVFIGFFLATLRGIQKLVEHIRHFGDKELTTAELTRIQAKEEAAAVQEEGER